jgi:hypothetical protein
MMILMVMTIILIFSFNSLIFVQAKPIDQFDLDSTIPVIFDESHLDPDSTYSLYQFDHDNAMQKPLELLSQLDLDQNFASDFNVTINTNRFTTEYFEEIGPRGILIMTLLDEKVGSTEGKVIKNWVESGGSIFIATQPDYAGFRYCKVEETNLLLKKLHVYDMFHLYQFEDSNGNYNSDELYDDTVSHQFTVEGSPTNPWDIVVTDAQFSDNHFGKEMVKGINKVLLGVSTIEVNSSEYVGAYSWPESYSVSDVTGEERLHAESIPWLVGTQLGKGKVVLLGSTFPVADWTIYGTTLQFIDQLDNMRLWFNIISWLSQANIGENTDSTTTPTSTSTTEPSSVNGFSYVIGLIIIIFVGVKRFRNQNRTQRYHKFRS